MAYDVWYTLPWIFEPFFDLSLSLPEKYITKTKVFALSSSHTSIDHPSRLHTLTISENDSLPSIISMPRVVQFDRIDTVHLLYHDWPIGLNLPSLRHLILTNNLVALKSFSSFPPSIRSIQILLCPHMPKFISKNWSVLRSLSALPMLTSLHIVLKDMETGLDEQSCEIIAEMVPMFVHFGICFRAQRGRPKCVGGGGTNHYVLNPADFGLDINNPADLEYITELVYEPEEINEEYVNSLFDMYYASIKELHRRILRSSFRSKPLIVVEEEGYGLNIWL